MAGRPLPDPRTPTRRLAKRHMSVSARVKLQTLIGRYGFGEILVVKLRTSQETLAEAMHPHGLLTETTMARLERAIEGLA